MDDMKPRHEGIGAPLMRREDQRFLTGRGQYTGDSFPENLCHAAFARTPHAHADIDVIDTSAAKGMPGVIAVLTGADALADGLGPIPHDPKWDNPPDVKLNFAPGYKVFLSEHPAMPAQRVRFVGEPVAMVIAETKAQAADAVAMIEVTYNVLPAVARAVDALKPDAPAIWSERPDNVALDAEVGDKAATDAAFAQARHVVVLDTWIKRVTGVPMEPRNAIGFFDKALGKYAVRAGSGGGVIKERQQLAQILHVDHDHCRAFSGDMGGNFGTRNTFFPEYALLPWAAKRLGRPVKWTSERTECFMTDYQGRDLASHAELALDAEGNFLAMRGGNISNIGAYTAHFTPMRKGLAIMQGVYKIPHVHFRGRAVMTNTVPTTPYRSAGRPEAIYIIERLVDMAADQCGFDPAELRRRNFIPPQAFPYTNAVGITYDNGEYELGMNRALELAKWPEFPARRLAAKKNGKLRGIGISNYIEGAGGAPRERAEITISGDGKSYGDVELVLGTMNSGQGHETSFPQLLCEWLGVPFDAIRYVAHDTDRVQAGGGSHSGRSMRIASLAVGEAADKLIAKGKKIAAHLLQAQESDVSFAKGVFTAKGASAGLFEVAQAAQSNADLPGELRGSFDAIGDVTINQGAFPSGTHICEVDVDPGTGQVELVHWYGVDDVGLAVNPRILHGQTHGAVAQGAGQALLEHFVTDADDAQALTASFMDYAMPRAHNMPAFTCDLIEVPATSHRYGIRPGGEGGTTPALGAVVNAVVDALSHLGVKHVEMPLTPENVWRAMRDAQKT